MTKPEITLVANMMMRDDDFPYLSATIPALHAMCDRIVLMHNGPWYTDAAKVQDMLREGDEFIHLEQKDPPNYSDMRNVMLDHVAIGEWICRWDPDELPTGSIKDMSGAYAIKELIRKDLQGQFTTVAMQCYHLVKGDQVLKIEFGYSHPRIFLKQPETRWEGKIHEQIRNPGKLYITPQVFGMAAIHFSYFSPERLKRKEKHYATIPGSGHGPGTLSRNISAGLRDLPPNVAFDTPEGWLEMVRGLT